MLTELRKNEEVVALLEEIVDPSVALPEHLNRRTIAERLRKLKLEQAAKAQAIAAADEQRRQAEVIRQEAEARQKEAEAREKKKKEAERKLRLRQEQLMKRKPPKKGATEEEIARSLGIEK